MGAAIGKGHLRNCAHQGPVLAQPLNGALGTKNVRQGVAPTGDRQSEGVAVGSDAAVQEGAEAGIDFSVDEHRLVQDGQGLARNIVVHGRGPQREPGGRRDGCGFRALAAHVAHDDAPGPAG